MSRVFIGIGSNEGDRLSLISTSVQALNRVPGVQVTQMAPIIETEPAGGPPQGPFLNTVVEIDTTLAPRALLQTLQAIERQLGRVPSTERWGPRPIDLDILLYGDRAVNEPDLEIPHPRLHERLFVLQPLAQLSPECIHPVLRKPIVALLQAISDMKQPFHI